MPPSGQGPVNTKLKPVNFFLLILLPFSYVTSRPDDAFGCPRKRSYTQPDAHLARLVDAAKQELARPVRKS
jgi:hypothetical protein